MSVDPIVLAHETPFDIGPVHVRPEVREIQHRGRTAILEPRVMQVLIALYRAGGHVVSKDDLIDCCWDQRVVGDDAINRVISRLRHNAQQDAGGAFKIETITKVGYRLSLASGTALPPRLAVSRRALVLTGSAVIGASVAGAAVYWSDHSSDSAGGAELEEIRRALLLGTPDQVANAMTRAENFVASHPRSADGWGLYAVASYFSTPGPTAQGAERRRRRTVDAARHALALDSKQPDARTTLASLAGFSGRWTAALKDIQPVYRDSPRAFFVNNYLASLFSQTGNYTLAEGHAQRAIDTEAQSPPLWMLKALALDNLGRLSDAQDTIERAYEMWPRQFSIWFTRLYLLGYNGRTAEALAMIQSSSDWPVGVPPDNQAMTRAQIVALGDRRPAIVQDALKRSMDMAPKGTGFAENAMQFTAALGMADEFFGLADRYYFDPSFIPGPARFSDEQRVYSRVRTTWFLFRRPMIAMWRDPRFDPLVKRIGLESFWRATGLTPSYRELR